jgi:tetratricopeptide (TPR) repeat protein
MHEGRKQTNTWSAYAGSRLELSDALGRRRPKRHPSSRTGENPPYGMIGGIEETSASFEARSAPRSYPTVSARVQEDAAGRVDLVFEDTGEQQLKNIARPVRVYRVRGHAAPGVIEPTLQAAETVRSAARPTNDLTAYDAYLRAFAIVVSSAKHIPEALRLLEQAIARDPNYGPALAWAATCCVRLLLDGRSEDPAADRLKGADFARRALEVAGDDPGILVSAAHALAYFGEDIGAMMALVDRALVLNPNYARGWLISGTLRSDAGQPDLAIEHVETALRLSPRARVGLPLLIIGGAHFLARRFDEAVPKLLLAIQEDASHPLPYRYLAACYAHTGRLEDAREIIARLRAITPRLMPDASYLRNPEHRELFLSGLRLAAGEET